jgi:hypothetical protein
VETELITYLVPLGVGGVLAGAMFLVYRKDAIQWQEAWKGQSQMLVQVIKENTVAVTALVMKLDSVASMVEDRQKRRS